MNLTANRLRELLHYAPETGEFTWKVKPNKRIAIGQQAGCYREDGYLVIRVDGRRYRASRLAWLFMEGAWPPALVDHSNRIRSDNRWVNLRLATYEENNANASLRSDNASGFKGVSFHTLAAKWAACISVSGRTRHLGMYASPEEASAAYQSAARQIRGEFACTI